MTSRRLVLAAALASALPLNNPMAETLEGSALTKALQRGGYVLVMRHAHSPMTPPAAGEADPENVNRERQLDGAGRQSAAAMGQAFAALHIPVGQVWSSPTYRALETIRLAGFSKPTAAAELGDHGASMQAAEQSQAAWLKARAAEAPRKGTDTVLVTHYPNIMAAFGQQASGLGDGEALVFRPNGRGGADLVARVKIEDWPGLAKG
jgi:phosphohistidine phosphatase SixA